MPDRAIMNGKPVFTVPSKTVINFKSGFQKKLLCDGPTFSTGTACAYSCSFCYVPAVMQKQEPWLAEHGATGAHEDIVIRRENPIEVARKQLKNAKDKDKPLVIYASPLVDVAANMDLVRETVQICKLILGETQWHIRLLSKSNLLPHVAKGLFNEVIDDVPWPVTETEIQARMIFGVSTGTLDDKLAQAFEEGCPLVSKRIESLHWLQDNGFRTFGMVCPSLPRNVFVDRGYEWWARETYNRLRGERLEHYWAEVINLRGESFTRTIRALTEAGFETEANDLTRVSTSKEDWEGYARMTYHAHASICPPEKLRFLQYAKPGSWWDGKPGVVLL